MPNQASFIDLSDNHKITSSVFNEYGFICKNVF